MTEHDDRRAPALGRLLDIAAVAEHLALSRAAVYRPVSRRLIPVYRLPCGIRIKPSDIDAFLAARLVEPHSPRRYGGQETPR